MASFHTSSLLQLLVCILILPTSYTIPTPKRQTPAKTEVTKTPSVASTNGPTSTTTAAAAAAAADSVEIEPTPAIPPSSNGNSGTLDFGEASAATASGKNASFAPPHDAFGFDPRDPRDADDSRYPHEPKVTFHSISSKSSNGAKSRSRQAVPTSAATPTSGTSAAANPLKSASPTRTWTSKPFRTISPFSSISVVKNASATSPPKAYEPAPSTKPIRNATTSFDPATAGIIAKNLPDDDDDNSRHSYSRIHNGWLRLTLIKAATANESAVLETTIVNRTVLYERYKKWRQSKVNSVAVGETDHAASKGLLPADEEETEEEGKKEYDQEELRRKHQQEQALREQKRQEQHQKDLKKMKNLLATSAMTTLVFAGYLGACFLWKVVRRTPAHAAHMAALQMNILQQQLQQQQQQFVEGNRHFDKNCRRG